MHSSIWQEERNSESHDLLIIGAGLSGLLSALAIRQRKPHWRIALLEAGSFASGASMANAGFACYGSPTEILDDAEKSDLDTAIALVENRIIGLELLLKQVRPREIDYRIQGGAEFFFESGKETFQAAAERLDALNKALGRNIYSIEKEHSLAHCLKYYFYTPQEASLHSGKLLEALTKKVLDADIDIHYGERVHHLERGAQWEVLSKQHRFKAEAVLVATNGFTHSLLPDLNVRPARGQMLFASGFDRAEFPNVHLEAGYFYARPYKGGLLLGGGRHLDRETENTSSLGLNKGIQASLDQLLERHFEISPKQVRLRWSGIMGFGAANEKVALVGESAPGLFHAVRLGGMGVAMSSHLAQAAADAICP